MDFKRYIREKKESTEAPEETTAVMAFGRFNPPTVGHEKLIQKVHAVAKEHKGEAHVIASHSQGTMKDPLPQDKKIGYLRSIAHGQVNISGSSKQEPTIFHAASRMHDAGHSHLVIVAGSDRVEQYQRDLDRYNGVAGKHGYYNFKSIKVISAGQRDPDAEGVEGMSGTKMRGHAVAGRISQFMLGLPEALKSHAKEMMDHIKSVSSSILPSKNKNNEDYENPYRFDWGTPEGTEYMKKMTPSMKTECGVGEVWSKEKGMCVPLREAYLNEEIYKLYDNVKTKNGDLGEIVYRGSSYVTIQRNDGSTAKHWLRDITETLTEETTYPRYVRNLRKEKKVPVLLMKPIKEDADTADYKLVPSVNSKGEPSWRESRFSRIRTANVTYEGVQEMYGERDINYNDSKNVNMGIDKVCGDQTVDGKPVGLVSFKTFMQDEVAKVAQAYQKNTDSIRQRQMEIDALGHHMHHPQNKLRMGTDD